VASAPAGRRDEEAFADTVRPLRAMTVKDYIQDDYPRTAIALAQDLAQRYPNDPEFLALEGDAWAEMGPRQEFDESDLTNGEKRRNANRRVFKTRQERERALLETPEGKTALAEHLAKAQNAYARTLALVPSYAPAYRGLGEVAERLGQPRAAAQAYVDYLQRAPDAADRPVIVQRLRKLLDALKAEEAHDATTTR
jgi:tetratricopeptide (TPR) repeat protein